MRVSSFRSMFLLVGLLSVSAAAFAADAKGPDGDPKAGKAIFENSCLLCHGSTGKGEGPAAAAFNPKPMAFGDAAKMSKISQETRIKAVTEGGASVGASPLMPAFKDTLSKQQILDVLAYIRKTFGH